jgi:hypothetical protein
MPTLRVTRRVAGCAGSLAALLLCQVATATAKDGADDHEAEADRAVAIQATVEVGPSRVLHHRLQFGENTHRFDYVSEGGQEVLFPFARYAVTATLSGRHDLEALYQPLTLVTQTRVDEDITIDDTTFVEGTPLDLIYGFDFPRVTYRYRVLARERLRLGLGAGLQLRNARISFDSADGAQRVISQDLGPVPVLSAAGRYTASQGHFVEATVEGFWAPLRYLNLRDVDVDGWLYDTSVRIGVPAWRQSEVFAGVRVLGGGADGTSGERTRWTQARARYTYNNLTVLALTLGARTP